MSVTNLVVNGWSVLGQGDGVPDSSLGDNGNFYLNLSNDTLYQKLGGEWVALVAMSGDGGVPSTRTISTSAPISGGGALSSNLTLSMLSATPARNGYMTLAQAGAVADLTAGLQGVETITAATGDIAVDKAVTFLNPSEAATYDLAAGSDGQFKFIQLCATQTAAVSGIGAGWTGGTAGDWVHVVYSDVLAKWTIIGQYVD